MVVILELDSQWLLRINPVWQLSTTQPLTCTNWKSKTVWTHGFWLGKGKSVCTQSKTRYSFTTSHQQASVQPFPGKRGPLNVTIYWEDKYHHSECSHLLILSANFYWCALYGMEYLFGQWGSAVPAVSPPKFLCPQPPHCWENIRNGVGLALCKHCSAITKTSVCCQHCFGHISKT